MEQINNSNIEKLCKICGARSAPQRHVCRYCSVKIHRARMKLAAVHLFGGKCAKCGFDEIPWVMEFHHPNDDKDFTISEMGVSWDAMKEELKKCIMLCANCHRAEHCARNNQILLNAVFDYEGDLDLGNYQFQFLSTETIKMLEEKNKYKLIKKHVPIAHPLDNLDKETLLGLIWIKPTAHIATEYGVSDSAIGKRCKKFGISKPPRGYWAKKQANHSQMPDNPTG